jgi:hypothetical protein
MSSIRPAWLWKIGLPIASIVICVLVIEIALRVVVEPRSSGTGAGALHRTFVKKYVTSDSQGYRNITPLSPGDMKFLFLGDSFTYGHGVKDGENFSSVFEHLTDTVNNNSSSTYNFSKNGSNSVQQLAYLKEFFDQHAIKDFRDKFLIYQYFGNDINYLETNNARPEFNYFEKNLVKLMKHSYLVDLLYQPFYIRKFSGAYIEKLTNLYENQESFNTHALDVGNIFNYIHDKNGKIIFIIFPFLNNRDLTIESNRIYVKKMTEVFGNLCQDQDFILDLQSVINDSGLSQHDIVVNEFDAHPSKELHSSIGRALAEAVNGSPKYVIPCKK